MTNDRLFDQRTLERNLDKGLITREEYDKYLAALPDAADNATRVEAEFVEGVLDAKPATAMDDDDDDDADGDD